MGKPKHPRMLADSEAQAIARNLRVSPRKLNLVAGLIRNRPASDAIATLTFSKRRIAKDVRKTLQSAIANAENNHQLDVDRLIVSRAEVGRAIVMRRFHARGRGRASRIEKWFSHLKIVVAERSQEEEAILEAARELVARPARAAQPERAARPEPVAQPIPAVQPEPPAPASEAAPEAQTEPGVPADSAGQLEAPTTETQQQPDQGSA